MNSPGLDLPNKTLAILGASGHGKVIADLAELLGHRVVFFDSCWPDCSVGMTQGADWNVEGTLDHLLGRLSDFDGAIVAIGNNNVRAKLQATLESAGAPITSLIHPSAQVSRYARIDSGSVVFANAAINAGVLIGKGAIINTGATVDHDCCLADFVHISPGANLAGNVSVGSESWVGIGAAVRQGIVIGEGVTVGAGAAVVSDVASGSCVVGVPARPIVRR